MSELDYGELTHGVSNFWIKLQQFKDLELPYIVVVVVIDVAVLVVVFFVVKIFFSVFSAKPVLICLEFKCLLLL